MNKTFSMLHLPILGTVNLNGRQYGRQFVPVDTKTVSLKLLVLLIIQCVIFKIWVGMAPQDGFEPPAKRLTVACSTAELLGNKMLYTLLSYSCNKLNHKYLYNLIFFYLFYQHLIYQVS